MAWPPGYVWCGCANPTPKCSTRPVTLRTQRRHHARDRLFKRRRLELDPDDVKDGSSSSSSEESASSASSDLELEPEPQVRDIDDEFELIGNPDRVGPVLPIADDLG
jgi:hypothetical protein